jgi:superfamily II DNA or RNA helicase
MRIDTDRGLDQEIREHFTFEVPGYKFMPSYKSGRWDGKIRLFDIRAKTLYVGLLPKLQEFAEARDYSVCFSKSDFPQTEFSTSQALEFIKTLNLPASIVPYDYQVQSLVDAVQNQRVTFLSPTASGKSLMMYIIARYIMKKTLIIVPTIDLVNQFADDIESYGGERPHKIFAEQDKNTDSLVTVSTWQSIHKDPKKWFDQFEVVLGDEVHNFKADSLVNIMTKLEQCKYRFGFTGTLNDSLANKLVIEGLFGQVKVVTTTREMVDAGRASAFDVKCLVMGYSDEEKRYASALKYQDEIDYIVTHKKRNAFITKLATGLTGNTLVLFNFVKHGKELLELIEKATDRPVYFVYG